jgi:ABC-type lipoprotein release transport system permease subunit
MKEEFTIAWRNLWRNRRRTLITAASVFFAVFFAVIMRSIQLGSYDRMINNLIESFTGHLQVQHVDYHDDPLIDNSFVRNDSLIAAISSIDRVVSVTPHLESFALASSGIQTKGVAVIAIDPLKEKDFSDTEARLVRYRITDEVVRRMEESKQIPGAIMDKVRAAAGRSWTSEASLRLEFELDDSEDAEILNTILGFTRFSNSFLSAGDEGVLVSDRLAGFLKVGIGDSVILMGQGYHGVSAAGLYPVRGIIKMPSPEIDNKLVVMTIPAAQQLYDAGGMITALAVNLTDRSNRTIKSVKKDINSILGESGTTARTWYELNPVLFQQIQGDSQTGQMMLGILYFIIFFGIFGTVLMMVSERKREFGVLVSIGMQKGKLQRIVVMEMILLGIFGLVAGLVASVPLITWYYVNPYILRGDLAKMMEDWGWEAVMPTAPVGPYFFWQALIVLCMVLLAVVYPMRKISRLKEIEALRS